MSKSVNTERIQRPPPSTSGPYWTMSTYFSEKHVPTIIVGIFRSMPVKTASIRRLLFNFCLEIITRVNAAVIMS